MKIYVAAKFEDALWARLIQAALRKQGHTITHDWTTKTVEGVAPAERSTYYYACAMNDMRGVHEADALVLLAHPQSRGAYVELGAALALGKLVVAVNPTGFDCLFFHHPGIVRMLKDDAQLLHFFRYMPGAKPS